jgi:ribosomal-protein-alanine N-acetyltransferase
LAGGEAEILTLAVAPSSRRQGIARALVAAVVAEVADVPVFLEVAADNEPAQVLYTDAGFTACGRRRDYYGPGRDAIVLRR